MATICPNGDIVPIVGDFSFDKITNYIDELDSFIDNDLQTIKGDLQSVLSGTETVSNGLSRYLGFPYKPIYWLPLLLIPTTFAIGTILAWKERSPLSFRSIQSNVLLPIFLIWIGLSCFLGAAIAYYGVMNAGKLFYDAMGS